MSKKYGQPLTKHGKNIEKYASQIGEIGDYLKDGSVSNEMKKDYAKKKINLLSAKVKRELEDYNSKVNKINNTEIIESEHRKIINFYTIIIETAEDIKGMKSDELSALEYAVMRSANRMSLLDLSI